MCVMICIMIDLLLTENLFDRVLREPARSYRRVYILSGYATPAMLSKWIAEMKADGLEDVNLRLLVGMASRGGVSISDHRGFVEIQRRFPDRVDVKYVPHPYSAHSKIYIWHDSYGPVIAYSGSANFTSRGLFAAGLGYHSEVLSIVDPNSAMNEYDNMDKISISVMDSKIDDIFDFLHFESIERHVSVYESAPGQVAQIFGLETSASCEYVVLPLVALNSSVAKGFRAGEVPPTSGLNWGHRSDGQSPRNPDEAYIPVPRAVHREHPGFFPGGTRAGASAASGGISGRIHFQIMTDDGKSMMFRLAQSEDKALHSVPRNSEVGSYFRHRLGVASSVRVETDHLVNYGSRFVRIWKIDDERYFMQFDSSVESEGAYLYGV